MSLCAYRDIRFENGVLILISSLLVALYSSLQKFLFLIRSQEKNVCTMVETASDSLVEIWLYGLTILNINLFLEIVKFWPSFYYLFFYHRIFLHIIRFRIKAETKLLHVIRV